MDDPAEHPVHLNGDSPSPMPTLQYEPAGLPEFRPLATFITEMEAAVAAGWLEARKLRCKVVCKGTSRRTRLLKVASQDWQTAVEILASTPARRNLEIPESELPPARALSVEVCPQCGSADVALATLRWKLLLTAVVFSWMPFALPLGIAAYLLLISLVAIVLTVWAKMACRRCGKRWKSRRCLTPLDRVDLPR